MMFEQLSASQLARIYNAITDGKPISKFESQPRALERVEAEILRMGLSVDEACARAFPHGVDGSTGLPDGPVNLMTGETLPRPGKFAHDPIRTVAGDPAVAARKVARAAGKKAREQAVAVVAPATTAKAAPAAGAARTGAARNNARLPQVVDALKAPSGVTLAELTVVAGWSAPFELRNLRIAAKKLGFTFEALPGGAYRLLGLTLEALPKGAYPGLAEG